MDMDSFSLKYDYPTTGNKKMDQEIKMEIDDDIEAFLQEMLFQEGNIYRLEISYDKKEWKQNLSYILFKTLDLGGAHPSTTIETINFQGERRVYIEDFLSLEKLKEVSQYVRGILLKRKGAIPEMIEAGTTAEYTNFRNFYWTKEGIVFLFEAYQVAPYSAGIVEVTVPYSLLGLTES